MSSIPVVSFTETNLARVQRLLSVHRGRFDHAHSESYREFLRPLIAAAEAEATLLINLLGASA